MEKFKAKIYKDEELLFDDITVSILTIIESYTGHTSWQCIFDIPLSERIEIGELCRIELEDGRIGNFIVSNIHINFQGPTKVYCSSCDPMQ